ncbi:MAG: glycosyltransferase family 39 protein [Syntrophales bacterium]|nr:glycosyltransferase family 39 protein [Syntrophales bacterium]MDD5531486.1 glycosyltransferase family 39 protein [Syntrophales bacterium]
MSRRKKTKDKRSWEARPVHQSIKNWSPADLLSVLSLIVICLAIGLPRYLLCIDFKDEGFLAYGAVRVLEGQIPNLDFFSLQPPLSFYTSAAAFKIFGISLVTLRIFGLILYILIPILIFSITRFFLPWPFALAAALPSTVIGMPLYTFVPLSVWQGITAVLAALFFYIQSIRSGRHRWAFLSGLFTAASILKKNQG